MKPLWVPVLVIAGLLQVTERARGDDFSDFRIPTHQALSWTGSFNGLWQGSTTDLVTSRSRQGRFDGAAGSDLRHLTDGESGFTDLIVRASLRGTRLSASDQSNEQTPLMTSSSDRQMSSRLGSEQGSVDYSFGRYLGRTPIVLGADATALGRLSQFWGDSRDASSQTDAVSSVDQLIESNSRAHASSVTVALRPRAGLGRVRDATWVYTARVIEERLRHDGVLTRALTHEARQKLADLLTTADAYDILHARPAKGLWAEIERVLGDDGALAPGGLDASSTQHAGEPLLDAARRGFRADGLPGTIVLRQRGASASAFVSGTHQRSTTFSESASQSQIAVDGVPQPITSTSVADNSVATSDAVDAGLVAEWHRPFGLRVQLDASAEASVPLRPQDDGFATRMNGLASWIVADRWLVQGSVRQERDLRQDASDGSTRQDLWGLGLSGSLIYEVEDHVTIQLGLQDVQTSNRVPGAFNPSIYRREQGITLALSYRFTGRFNAPGFEALSRNIRPPAGI